MRDRDFFARPATAVAPELLGAVLSVGKVALRITEVEAYRGTSDPGSHAFHGETPRNAAMFGEPGHLYVYVSYGVHHCVNVVCSPRGEASAVLLRAGEIVAGFEPARGRRLSAKRDVDLARGPGRLAAPLGITRANDGDDLFGAPLFGAPLFAASLSLEFPDATSPVFQAGPRTGVSGAGGGTAFPWRFWIPGEPTVSPYRPHAPRR
ncbi:MAG: DNA-3-methyladenine glycosylase [Microbacteriaceae bacterium]|nr:DNA-3-methyladenine glycosylase [Microbacteriaceae bacterium]